MNKNKNHYFKFISKNKKIIVIFSILFLILLFVIINRVNKLNSTPQENTQKEVASDLINQGAVNYKVEQKKIVEGTTDEIYLLITFQSDEKLQSIKYLGKDKENQADPFEIYGNGNNKISIDYKVEATQNYYFEVTTEAGNTEEIVINEIVTYVITYNLNGGNGNIPDTIWKKNIAEENITNNIPTRNDEIFIAWSTTSDESGTLYATDAQVRPTENMVLYAMYRPANPTMKIVGGTKGDNNWYTSNVEVEVKAGGNALLRKGPTKYSINGGAETEIVDGGIINITEDGIFTIVCKTYNSLGEQTGESTIEVKKDSTAPNISISCTSAKDGEAVLPISYSDNASGVKNEYIDWGSTRKWTGNIAANNSQTVTLNGFTVGNNATVTLNCIDNAGNKSSVSTTFYVKQTKVYLVKDGVKQVSFSTINSGGDNGYFRMEDNVQYNGYNTAYFRSRGYLQWGAGFCTTSSYDGNPINTYLNVEFMTEYEKSGSSSKYTFRFSGGTGWNSSGFGGAGTLNSSWSSPTTIKVKRTDSNQKALYPTIRFGGGTSNWTCIRVYVLNMWLSED